MIPSLKSPAWPAILTCALLQLPAAVHADPADKSASAAGDPVVATGKTFEIKRSQVDDAFIDYNASVVAGGRAIAEQDRPLVRTKLLDHLIVSKILLQKATEDDKTKVAKMVDDELAQARSNAPSPEAFDEQIKAKGMTLAQVRDQAVERQLIQSVLVREATNGIVITDAEVKKYYEDNPDKWKMPERVHVAHILISTLDPVTQQPVPPEKKKEKLKLANELKARAEKGEDFAALVKQYSDDPGSKSKGGEYTFSKGQMVPEFEGASFSMKTNQISDPVETRFGYHIIKLLEKLPAYTEDFARAEPAIREGLTEQAAEKGLPAYFDKIKAAADVKILDQSMAAPSGSTPAPAPK
ncbi:MAG TPA: peptidylprolyl isomerase [Verrucomicrobiae bacterium]|jgi:peptidyl-prolyl cis-trans isomerase C|nr:peptidylprolyl isomerase [Verrucomicrobiae bacterium]